MIPLARLFIQEPYYTGTDWEKFAQQWRNEFLSNSSVCPKPRLHHIALSILIFFHFRKRIASGEAGTSNIDTLHRQVVEYLLNNN